MEIKGKVHCFFEQSGTFKNEFIKLGIPAEDYDIQNNFGQTDHVMDLFGEIEDAWNGSVSLFDAISPDDLIVAFFPCIHFCNIAEYNQRSAQERWRKIGMSVDRIYELLEKRADDRHYFYKICLHLFGLVEKKGLRLIMENPWNPINYTNHFFFAKPAVIDEDRRMRGDYFKKPTGYWFVNCTPTSGFSYQPTKKEDQKIIGMTDVQKKKRAGGTVDKPCAKASSQTGVCSEERSMITPDYARNWICDFVLGRGQQLQNSLLF